MPWLIANWKLLALLGVIIGTWHAHTVYDGYLAQKGLKATITRLEDTQGKIVKFNSTYSRVKVNVKDICIDKPIPDELKRLQPK